MVQFYPYFKIFLILFFFSIAKCGKIKNEGSSLILCSAPLLLCCTLHIFDTGTYLFQYYHKRKQWTHYFLFFVVLLKSVSCFERKSRLTVLHKKNEYILITLKHWYFLVHSICTFLSFLTNVLNEMLSFLPRKCFK